MKLELKKTSLVNLSEDLKELPAELTPHVAGASPDSVICTAVCWTALGMVCQVDRQPI